MMLIPANCGRMAVQQAVVDIDYIRKAINADPSDVAFVKDVMRSNTINHLIKAHERLELTSKPLALQNNNLELTTEVIEDILHRIPYDDNAAELVGLLNEPHIHGILEAHDAIADRAYVTPPISPCIYSLGSSPMHLAPFNASHVPVQLIGMKKSATEPLGITLKREGGAVKIARVFDGGVVHRQGLLKAGDIIKQVDGQDVSSPTKALDIIKAAKESFVLKILPSLDTESTLVPTYLKAYFDYEPSRDKLIPCKDAGLSFSRGDILEIVNREDNDWWQARMVGEKSRAGLIPSKSLQSYRVNQDKMVKQPTVDVSSKNSGFWSLKRRKKAKYVASRTAEFDNHDFQVVYEEVIRLPPFQRKSLVLIGAQGVGRRHLKNKLIGADPERFAFPLPTTTRLPRPDEQHGKQYHFEDYHAVLKDVQNDLYLESGEYENNLYGTKLENVLDIIHSGKMCVLDCSPHALRLLKCPRFLPYIVFVGAPSLERLQELNCKNSPVSNMDKGLYSDMDLIRTFNESLKIEKSYSNFFDLKIVNDNPKVAFDQLKFALESLATNHQWIPASWVNQ